MGRTYGRSGGIVVYTGTRLYLGGSLITRTGNPVPYRKPGFVLLFTSRNMFLWGQDYVILPGVTILSGHDRSKLTFLRTVRHGRFTLGPPKYFEHKRTVLEMADCGCIYTILTETYCRKMGGNPVENIIQLGKSGWN